MEVLLFEIKEKSTKNKSFNPRKCVRQGSACATDLNNQPTNSPIACSYIKNPHKLENCIILLKLEHQEKLNHLQSLALCFGCLKKGHMTNKCTNRLTCSVCKRKHPTILHYESKGVNKQHEQSVSIQNSNIDSPSIQSTTDIVSQIEAGDLKSSCAMAIVPVKVKLIDKLITIDTYTFFDTGSSVSFYTESLMRQLA